MKASSTAVDTTTPKNASWGSFADGYAASANATLNPAAIGITGGSQPHNNMQPYLALYFCIATQGIYPPRP
ncbi:phage tail protein [Janthinobacterium sp. HLX7-2]|uniref:phage tail protein n=1 Tax=Janthinobacterium sp. HLX7-2 TaxID=1259331 RepID=UPI003F29CBD0